MSFFIFSCRKLFLKHNHSSLNNKISTCTHYVAFNIINYKTVKDSLYYCDYIAVGYLYDRKVTEYHFQTINCKRKQIEAEILKTCKKHL